MRTRAYLTRQEAEAVQSFLLEGAAGSAVAPTAPSAIEVAVPLLGERCVRCHSGGRVDDAVARGESAQWWGATLGRMRDYGAELTPAERVELGAALTAAGGRTVPSTE